MLAPFATSDSGRAIRLWRGGAETSLAPYAITRGQSIYTGNLSTTKAVEDLAADAAESGKASVHTITAFGKGFAVGILGKNGKLDLHVNGDPQLLTELLGKVRQQARVDSVGIDVPHGSDLQKELRMQGLGREEPAASPPGARRMIVDLRNVRVLSR